MFYLDNRTYLSAIAPIVNFFRRLDLDDFICSVIADQPKHAAKKTSLSGRKIL